jgi:hypothetical protein
VQAGGMNDVSGSPQLVGEREKSGCLPLRVLKEQISPSGHSYQSRPSRVHTQGMSTIPEGELEAAVAARQELGPTHETEVVDSFLDRIEQGIDKRIDERLVKRVRGGAGHGEQTLKLALGSMGIGIGVTAVATGPNSGGGTAIAIVAWVAIALINIAYARRP